MYDIVTIGSALLDIYVTGQHLSQIEDNHSHTVIGSPLDDKTEVDNIIICSGGGASNNAVSFARKNYRVGIIAELGTDLAGATVKEELKREQVELGLLIEEESETTGTSVIMVSETGRRAVNVYRGASGMLSSADIPYHLLDTNWLYISSLGGNIVLLSELLDFAKIDHIKVAVNPGSLELERLSRLNYSQILSSVDVLIMNRSEAVQLTHQPFDHPVFFKSSAAQIPNIPLTIITDGRQGGKVIDHQQSWFYRVSPAHVCEETGAGDAFGSGVVAALMAGHNIHTAIEWGKHQAASVVGYIGAKKGLLTQKELSNLNIAN